MRIRDFLATFVVAGFLSCSVAGEDVFEKSERIPHHMHLLGYMNTTGRDIENFDEKMCTKIGGPKTYEAHKRNWEHFGDCLSALRSEVREEIDAGSYTSMRHVTEASYEKFCERVSRVEHCFKNVTETMKICLEPEKHDASNLLYNSISSVIRLMCQDGAIRLIEFDAAGGDRCVDTNMNHLLNCANQTVFKYIKKTMPDGAAVGGLGALHLLVPDMEKCTIMYDFQQCATGILHNNCKNRTAENLFNEVLNVIRKTTTCDHILPKSLTKSSGVINANVNGLMMTVLIVAMSLKFAYN